MIKVGGTLGYDVKGCKKSLWKMINGIGRKIFDGPLILSEIIDWYKKRKKKLMLFKVDFEKAFDSVSWKYLDYMIHKMGFGSRWRTWINNCLMSARASIIINGSPTSEFSLKRGIDLGGCQTSETWAKIVESINHLHSSGMVPLNSICFKLEMVLLFAFRRILGLEMILFISDIINYFTLKTNKDCFISQHILNGSWKWDWCRPITMGRSKTEFDNLIIDISNMEIDDLVESDTYVWSLSNDDSISVNSVRKHIDEHYLPSLFPCTRWYKMIHKKAIQNGSCPEISQFEISSQKPVSQKWKRTTQPGEALPSAKSTEVGQRALPGVFFFYDLSAIKVCFILIAMVSYTETHPPLQFLTNLYAIVGGIFSCRDHRFVYHGQRALKKKSHIGKLA
nr:cysteine-rich receptor-like protein kinase [Tanacetum cinerariifolium]